MERVIQALNRGKFNGAISELDWYQSFCILPEDEKIVEALAVELEGHPEVKVKDEMDRMLQLEKLLFDRFQRPVSD